MFYHLVIHFCFLQCEAKTSHHKAIHMTHKIHNEMTESGDKGKNTGQRNKAAPDLGQLPAPFRNT